MFWSFRNKNFFKTKIDPSTKLFCFIIFRISERKYSKMDQ